MKMTTATMMMMMMMIDDNDDDDHVVLGEINCSINKPIASLLIKAKVVCNLL
jgi:hypothetical protein